MKHNNLLLTGQERLSAELLIPTSKNTCKSRKKDVTQTGNNFRHNEIPSKLGISNANKLPMKKNPSRVIQPIETKNHYWPLETEESPTENKNTRTDKPTTTITAKQNAIDTATQDTQKSNDKKESDTPDKRKLSVTVILGDSMG